MPPYLTNLPKPNAPLRKTSPRSTATKNIPRNLKHSQDDSLRTLKNTLNEKRDNPDTSTEEIQEIEQEVDEVLSTICDQEAQKMETFRLPDTEFCIILPQAKIRNLQASAKFKWFGAYFE